MKKILLPIFALLFLISCDDSNDNNDLDTSTAFDLTNVSYGSDAHQKMDVYLPANRNAQTKVLVLVHGGGWSAGSRQDMAYLIPSLKAAFPNHAIVNLDYRLGTIGSPGFPKQIEDLEKAIAFLKSGRYHIGNRYGFIGASAGAHLSLLYGYAYDPGHEVKAVCSIVGPTDFTDPAYTEDPVFMNMLGALVGTETYTDNPGLFEQVSPRTHVSGTAPATVQFNGGQDPLIPVSQATRLKEKLDGFDIYNEYYLYPNGGHGDWDLATWLDVQTKMVAFFETRF